MKSPCNFTPCATCQINSCPKKRGNTEFKGTAIELEILEAKYRASGCPYGVKKN